MKPLQIPVHGGHLFLQRAGHGEAVLFVHGWSFDHRAFVPQFEAVKNQFTALNFDRRGFGQSSAPPSLRRETEDIRNILDTLDVTQAHVVGMSQGGRIALRFASEFPERIRTLVLQGTAADEIDIEETAAESIPIETFADLVQKGRLRELASQWLAHPMMSSGDNLQVNGVLQSMLTDYTGNDLKHYNAADYSWRPGLLSKLRQMTQPVLLMTGAKDSRARRRIASRLLEILPNGREHLFEEDGHLCNLTAAEEFNAVLLEFLTSAA